MEGQKKQSLTLSNPKPCVRCGAGFEKCGPRVYCDACQADVRREAQARWRAKRRSEKRQARRSGGRPRKTDRPKTLYVNWEAGDRMILAGADVKDVARTLRVAYGTVYARRRKLQVASQGRADDREPWQDRSSPDRGTLSGFSRYMAANPFYFEDIFKAPYSPQNVRSAFGKISGVPGVAE